MGLTPVGGLEKSFSEHFDLRTLLHYLNVMYRLTVSTMDAFSTHDPIPLALRIETTNPGSWVWIHIITMLFAGCEVLVLKN